MRPGPGRERKLGPGPGDLTLSRRGRGRSAALGREESGELVWASEQLLEDLSGPRGYTESKRMCSILRVSFWRRACDSIYHKSDTRHAWGLAAYAGSIWSREHSETAQCPHSLPGLGTNGFFKKI